MVLYLFQLVVVGKRFCFDARYLQVTQNNDTSHCICNSSTCNNKLMKDIVPRRQKHSSTTCNNKEANEGRGAKKTEAQ